MTNPQSTPEEQIALLNKEKEENLSTIGKLNESIQQKDDLIKNYSSAITEFEGQIVELESKIVELNAANSIIDEIITKITPTE